MMYINVDYWNRKLPFVYYIFVITSQKIMSETMNVNGSRRLGLQHPPVESLCDKQLIKQTWPASSTKFEPI